VFEAVELQVDQQRGEVQTIVVAAKLGPARMSGMERAG
jgi:hypothetical protein